MMLQLLLKSYYSFWLDCIDQYKAVVTIKLLYNTPNTPGSNSWVVLTGVGFDQSRIAGHLWWKVPQIPRGRFDQASFTVSQSP